MFIKILYFSSDGYLSLPHTARKEGSNTISEFELKSKSLNRTNQSKSTNSSTVSSQSNSSMDLIAELKAVNGRYSLKKTKKPEAVKKFYGAGNGEMKKLHGAGSPGVPGTKLQKTEHNQQIAAQPKVGIDFL